MRFTYYKNCFNYRGITNFRHEWVNTYADGTDPQDIWSQTVGTVESLHLGADSTNKAI